MASFIGVAVAFLAVGNPVGVSTNIDDFTAFSTGAFLGGAKLVAAHPAAPSAPSVIGTGPHVGALDELGGLTFFDRIHVYPRNGYAAGLLLSTVNIPVEVWSAERVTSRTLQAIVITDDGVTVTDPYGVPVVFTPFQSRAYTVTLNIVGPPNIDNTVTWDFAGIGEPVFVLSGSRLVPFLFDPDWSEPVEDTIEYATDVMTSEDGTEQRFGLRSLPRRRLRWRALTLDARETAAFDRLVETFLPYRFGVPLWQNAVALSAALAPGATVIPFTTAGREFNVGDTVVLTTDPFTFEATTIQTVSGTQITVTALVGTWPAGATRVLPIRFGRLPADFAVERLTRDKQSATVEFALEPV